MTTLRARLIRTLAIGLALLIGVAAGVSLWYAVTLSIEVDEFAHDLRRGQVESCERVNVVRVGLDLALDGAIAAREQAGRSAEPFATIQRRLRDVPHAMPGSPEIDCERAVPRDG